MYSNDESKEKVVMIQLFGIRYAQTIQEYGLSITKYCKLPI